MNLKNLKGELSKIDGLKILVEKDDHLIFKYGSFLAKATKDGKLFKHTPTKEDKENLVEISFEKAENIMDNIKESFTGTILDVKICKDCGIPITGNKVFAIGGTSNHGSSLHQKRLCEKCWKAWNSKHGVNL